MSSSIQSPINHAVSDALAGIDPVRCIVVSVT